jgi:hypothetical protein
VPGTFTPFNGEQEAIYRPFSGVTWHPCSYNVESNLMYIFAGLSDIPCGGSAVRKAGR